MTLLIFALLGYTPFLDDFAAKKLLSTAERKEIAERVCAAARQAVAESDVARTEFTPVPGQTAFDELNKLGVVLIGFRLGVSQIADRMVIHSLEPIYMTTRGEIYGAKRGRERPLVAKRNKSSAVATEILRAKPGYAVGAIHLHVGSTLEGIKAVFLRVKDDKLNSEDRYESKWVGVVTSDRPKVIDGGGHLVIGLRGVEAAKDLLQVGLVFAGKSAAANAVVDTGAARPKGAVRPGSKVANSPPDGLFKKMDSAAPGSSAPKRRASKARRRSWRPRNGAKNRRPPASR